MSNISKAQIFNLTLNTLGISSPIENTKMQDSRAILLNNYYPIAKDCVLKDFDWNFASCYKELSLIQTQEGKYKYSFDYPNDCINARQLFEKSTNKPQEFTICCDIEGNKLILANVKEAILRYTKRIDKEIYFTSEFTMALCYYLASLTSNVLTGNIQKGELAYEKYKKILSKAKVINAQEGVDVLFDDTTYLDSRG